MLLRDRVFRAFREQTKRPEKGKFQVLQKVNKIDLNA